MKHIFLFLIAMTAVGSVRAQHLVTGNSDVVGLSDYPASPFLVEAGPQSFYWISGSRNATVTHPMLNEVYSDFKNIYFIKYSAEGGTLSSNYIRGNNYATNAFSHNGGLTVVARANEEVDASGNILSLNGANNMEFIANYDQSSELDSIINVWNLSPSQSAYSMAEMDKRDGSVYLYGYGYQLMEVAGYGVIGKKEESKNYLYVLKYGQDLQLDWVYTAGFDTTVSANGYYMNLKVFPDIQGNVVVTGSYETNCSPLFGNEILESYQDGFGLFAVKLDGKGSQVWVNPGSMNGYGYDTHIFRGMAMKNGDLIMAGVTTTGSFNLGDAKFEFVNGSGYTNMFAYRMRPDGTFLWATPFQNMGINYGEGKKGTGGDNGIKGIESEEFFEEIYYDAIQWNGKVMYMTGSFLNEAFNIAGRTLEKKYSDGIFVAAVDLRTGEEIWGYALSSDWVGLHGFDSDGSGNVSLMGYTSDYQDFEGIEEGPIEGAEPVFHLGIDYNGNPLWYNNAYLLQGPGYRLNGCDLEVLWGGHVFSSVYLSQADQLLIGDTSLFFDHPYTSWLIALEADMELGGKVADQSGSIVYPGYVSAYKSSRSGAYPKVDSVMLNDAGVYLFDKLYPGNYTLQVHPDPELYPDGIPTYVGGQVAWDESQFLDIKPDTKAGFLDISIKEVAKLTAEDGSGSMLGNVSYVDEEVLKGTMARPVKRASVILVKRAKKSTNAGEVVAYIETDDLGNYIFENVPNDDYILIVDIVGLPMIQTYDVTILGNQIVSGLDYYVGGEGISTSGGVGVKAIEMDHFIMFPNPGDGTIFLIFPAMGDYQVRIYSTDGRMVASGGFESTAGLRTLDISEQDQGIYLIRVDGPDGTSVLKYILK